jgi:hypothetical protein
MLLECKTPAEFFKDLVYFLVSILPIYVPTPHFKGPYFMLCDIYYQLLMCHLVFVRYYFMHEMFA